MKMHVTYNEEFNQKIKENIFTYSLLFTTPSDYLRQIFMTCGGGYEYDPSTGEIVNFDGDREYETEMKYPEVSHYVPETMIRDAKMVLHDPSSVKNMTDKTMAALSMFCQWVVERSQRSGYVYKPDEGQMFKAHTSYNVPDGFAEYVTTASLVYKALDTEYCRRHDIKYNVDAIEQILEMLHNVGNDD